MYRMQDILFGLLLICLKTKRGKGIKVNNLIYISYLCVLGVCHLAKITRYRVQCTAPETITKMIFF